MRYRSFTLSATGILRAIQTDCAVGSAFHAPAGEHAGPPNLKNYRAIWDTGATGSVISQKVVDECGLKPIGMTVAHGVQGQHTTEVYLVCILLPNGVGLQAVRVTKGILGSIDVLIGMDVICEGDFAVTHKEGKTCFSFRIPSAEKIDFVTTHRLGSRISQDPQSQPASTPPTQVRTPMPRVGRNDPCPCGSGKKFKKCCLN